MDKNAILDAIQKAHDGAETCRRSLQNIKDPKDKEYQRIREIFDTDKAFRNGLAHALYLSGELTQVEIKFLKKRYHIPNRFLE